MGVDLVGGLRKRCGYFNHALYVLRWIKESLITSQSHQTLKSGFDSAIGIL